jgi:hypothetical protein
MSMKTLALDKADIPEECLPAAILLYDPGLKPLGLEPLMQ